MTTYAELTALESHRLAPHGEVTIDLPAVTPGRLRVEARPTATELILLLDDEVVAHGSGTLGFAVPTASRGYRLRCAGASDTQLAITYPSTRALIVRRIPLLALADLLEEHEAALAERLGMPGARLQLDLAGDVPILRVQQDGAELELRPTLSVREGRLAFDVPGQTILGFAALEALGEAFSRWLLGGQPDVLDLRVAEDILTIEHLEPLDHPDRFAERSQPVTSPGALDKIDHIVVLTQSGRSYDHVLGYLSCDRGRDDLDGLRADLVNELAGQRFAPFPLGRTSFAERPPASHAAAKAQIDGGMAGFVREFAHEHRHVVGPGQIMGYLAAAELPVYDVLAREFAVCDRWFAPHPGPGFPNRHIQLTGRLSRDGFDTWELDGPDWRVFAPRHGKTVFEHLEARGVDWRYYTHGVGTPHLFARLADDAEHVVQMRDDRRGFFADARRGSLPAVAFLDPDFLELPPGDNDRSPCDMRGGQRLVGEVVTALMDGPRWSKTLLIVVYDEPGGFYDHVAPPEERGARVPALIVSPWIAPGTACHTVFDHASILRTIVRRFLPDRPPDLGDRANRAADLGELLTLAAPRADRLRMPMVRSDPPRLLALGEPVPPARDFRGLLMTAQERRDRMNEQEEAGLTVVCAAR